MFFTKILTFHYPHNYGAFLQAFSLQKSVGKQCNILNFIPNYTYTVNYKLTKRLPVLWHFIALYRFLIQRDRSLFSEFSIYTLTPIYNDVKKIFKSNTDQSNYIVGSDQVWNPYFIPRSEDVYFLNFGSPSAKRISYAASLGMQQWPKDFEQKVLPMLQRFDAISVREESAVPYLTSLGLKNVVCVCDPTILHNANFYREQFQGAKYPTEKYAFVYKLREITPVTISDILPQNVITVDLQKKRTMVSVTQWLANIDYAQFVVTDSFHGTIFCLLFHKPFIVLPNRSTGKGMNERFVTLLGETGLEYRCLTCAESSEEILEKLNRPIDWDYVDAVLEEWRNYSGNWLKQALAK
jgi:hypothetical protein